MKKIMMFLIILIVINTYSDRIRMKSGDIYFNVEVIKISEEELFLKDGRSIALKDVREIGFGKSDDRSNEKADSIVKLSEREFQKYQRYFKQGSELSDKYPGSNYIQIVDSGENELRSDGTRTFKYTFVAYVSSPAGKSDLSSFSFHLSPESYKYSINHARVIHSNGVMYNYDEDNYSIIKPETESWSYGAKDIIVYDIPNVEVGSIVEYSYETDTFNPYNKRIFTTYYNFQGSVPVLKSDFTVIIPARMSFEQPVNEKKERVIIPNITLNYFTKNIPENKKRPVIRRTDEKTFYYWEMTDIPPLIEEPNSMDRYDLIPFVEATIFKDRKYLDEWVAGFLNEKIVVTPLIKKTVQEITEKNDDAEAKLAKIYHWIQKNIIYLSVKGSISSGLTGHPAEETLINRKGDCIDKAILFSAMVEALEIPDLKAYPVTVKSNDSAEMIVEIPTLDGNHAISEIHFNEKVFYLDSTASSYRYPYFRGDNKGVPAVNEILGTIRYIPVPPPEDEMNFYNIEFKLNKNGKIKGMTQGIYTGDYEAYLRELYMYYGGKQRKMIMQNMVNSMAPKVVLKGYEISDVFDFFEPFKLKYSYELYEYPTMAGNYIIMKVPLNYYFSEVNLDSRKYPIEYSTSRMTGNNIEIEIPSNYEISYIPENIELKTDDFEYTAIFHSSEGKITFKDSYKRFNRIIDPVSYPEYREKHLGILSYIERPIVLKKRGSK